MTNEQDPGSTGNPGDDAGQSADISDITPLDSDTEAWIIGALASLPPVAMPDDVHQRILTAIAAEPNPYVASTASDSSSTSSDTSAVTELPQRRRRSSGWFISVAGIAAASVLALVVGTSVLDEDSGPTVPITTAAIPMTASTKQYQKENFSAQVAAELPGWRSSSKAQEKAEPTGDPTPVTTTSATPQPSTSPSETIRALNVDTNTREQVAACLAKLSNQTPMHVEIASYRANPTTPAEQVAVAALDGDNKSVEVYAIKVTCNDGDAQLVRDHVTLSSP